MDPVTKSRFQRIHSCIRTGLSRSSGHSEHRLPQCLASKGACAAHRFSCISVRSSLRNLYTFSFVYFSSCSLNVCFTFLVIYELKDHLTLCIYASYRTSIDLHYGYFPSSHQDKITLIHPVRILSYY